MDQKILSQTVLSDLENTVSDDSFAPGTSIRAPAMAEDSRKTVQDMDSPLLTVTNRTLSRLEDWGMLERRFLYAGGQFFEEV